MHDCSEFTPTDATDAAFEGQYRHSYRTADVVALTETLVAIALLPRGFYEGILLLVSLDYEARRFELLDSHSHPQWHITYYFLVKLEYRVSEAQAVETALAVYACTSAGALRTQSFEVLVVRDGRFVSTCARRLLEHSMLRPVSVDDRGRRLICDTLHKKMIVLDTQTGEQTLCQLDKIDAEQHQSSDQGYIEVGCLLYASCYASLYEHFVAVC